MDIRVEKTWVDRICWYVLTQHHIFMYPPGLYLRALWLPCLWIYECTPGALCVSNLQIHLYATFEFFCNFNAGNGQIHLFLFWHLVKRQEKSILKILYTGWTEYYRKCVLHLLKGTWNMRLPRCNIDLRYYMKRHCHKGIILPSLLDFYSYFYEVFCIKIRIII